MALVLAFGLAWVYGASLEAVPSVVQRLLLPELVLPGLFIVVAAAVVVARRVDIATAALLVGGWSSVLGSFVWQQPDPRFPFWSVVCVEPLLVDATRYALLGSVGALGGVLLAWRFEPARPRKATLAALAVWVAAHLAGAAIERLAAVTASPPKVGALAMIASYAVAAAIVMVIVRRAAVSGGARLRRVWIPCVLVLAAGPADMIRAGLASSNETGAALAASIDAGELEPWRATHPMGDLPPLDALVVYGDGRRVGIHRGRARALGPAEIWSPSPSAQPAVVVPDASATAAQVIEVLRQGGTRRVHLAAIDHLPTPALLAAISVRAATYRVAVIPIEVLWLEPPFPRGREHCVDMRALPSGEPILRHVRGVECIGNVAIEGPGPPLAPYPHPWLPSRPSWPPLVLLAAALLPACASTRFRSARRSSLAVAVTLAAILAGIAFMHPFGWWVLGYS